MNKDDILETALNFGIKSTSIRYGVSEEEVRKIVIDFKNDNGDEDSCDCQRSMKDGKIMFCFVCTGFNSRIKI